MIAPVRDLSTTTWQGVRCPRCGALPGVACYGDDIERFAHAERNALVDSGDKTPVRRTSINVIVHHHANAIRLVPIAYDPPDLAKAIAIVSTIFPTWRSAKEFCDAEGIFVGNRDGVADAIANEAQAELRLG